jgi:iron complex outermembrane recepter protein
MNGHAHRSLARRILASMFACMSLCWMSPLLAQEGSRRHDVDIPAAPLGQALQLFSEQTRLQYGYLPTDDEEEQLMVGPVKGRLTANEVLAKLLPEGFTFAWTNPRLISIISPPANEPPGGVRDVVAAKEEQHSELSEEQKLAMANGDGEGGSARDPYAFNWETLVEASKIFDGLDLDIPMVVLERKDIDRLGVSTLADLMDRVVLQPFKTAESQFGDGTQVANLRGLGFDTTLVLINGRRTSATASGLTFNAFDLNSIPLGAVDRVEIVSDSMSAIHGMDAIGGVLNIVLRDEMAGPRLDIDYGAAAGGAVERHGAFGAYGRAGRARGSVVVDYFDRSPLFGWERDRWNNQDFTRYGSIDWRSPAASPGNVSSPTFGNLPGLPASFAAIPRVDTGAALIPADFLETAGQQNLDSLYKYRSTISARMRKGVSVQGEYAITPQASVFGEALYVDRDLSVVMEPPSLRSTLVPATNPHNPFGADVLVDVLLGDLGPRTVTHTSEMTRAVAGAHGRAASWHWETSIQQSRDKDFSVRTKDLDLARVAMALSADHPNDALDVFGGSGANSAELLSSLLAAPARSHSSTETTQATAHLRGPMYSLPAGRVELLIGAEWREEDVRYDFGPPANFAGAHQRSVIAAFGEVRLPLVDSAAKLPAVHGLSLLLSGRFDDYSDVGGSFNPEYAVIWRPVAPLTVRTSWSQGFRPPPLFDLHLPLLDVIVPIVDPARDGEFASPTWRVGGNPDLRPSTADALTTSIQFVPRELANLRLGGSYWRIRVKNTVGVPQPEHLLLAETSFPDRVLRGEPSAADVAAGLPGPLRLIDVTRLNFGSIRTSGMDFNASMEFDTSAGIFRPDVSATWVDDFETTDLVEGPDFNRVGVADLLGSVVRWRAVASLSWTRQGFGASAAVRYVPAYSDVDTLRRSNGRKVDSQALVDIQLSMDLGERVAQGSPWDGFEIRAGVFNLFDDEAPFAEAGWLNGFDASQADLKQRFGYIKLAKKF